MSEPTNEELERFRLQWQQEVSSRRRKSSAGAGPSTAAPEPAAGPASPEGQAPNLQTAIAKDGYHDGWLDGGSYNFDELEAREEARRLGKIGTGVHPESRREPQTALEHFERAVEKEGQGNMQESLIHYRKAYKLDDQVDRVYRHKHFPPTKFPAKPVNANPSNKSVTIPNTAHHSLHGSKITLSDLVASFAGAPIQAAIPEVEGQPQAPCPIAAIPHEILVNILGELAVRDVASFMRTSLACKHLAYVTHAEDRIWREVCNESRFGFADMKYDFALTHQWQDLPRPLEDDLDDLSLAVESSEQQPAPKLLPTLSSTYPSFLENFHSRPRIRFSGVYISTVNYIRAGMHGANSLHWGNSPVHMVTYYRYLRFYRDGSAISLLTFYEPHDVVPLMHKANLLSARKNTKNVPALAPAPPTAASGQPQPPLQPPTSTAVMREARKARWRMSYPHLDMEEAAAGKQEPEGNVYVELEGPTRAYTYHMQMALRSVKAAGVAKNTKLAWRSFWSYSMITDDWGEFALKNDRAFVFSRVKSWADA